MHVLIENGTVKRYPYGLGELQRDNPNVSFARNNDSALEAFGVFRVYNATPPDYDARTQALEEGKPTFDLAARRWSQVWEVRDLTAEELEERYNAQAAQVRAERNAKLSETDWRFRSDLRPSQAWIDYCQALRDITAQAGFPWEVQWPEMPA